MGLFDILCLHLIHGALAHCIVLIEILSLIDQSRRCAFLIGWAIRVCSTRRYARLWNFEHALFFF